MKRFVSLALAALMVAATLSACAPKEQRPAELTPEERTELYKTAIEANGGEAVEYNPPITTADDPLSELLFGMLGLTAEDMSAYAISLSPMNTQAYCIALIMPAKDKAKTVTDGLNAFVEQQKTSFELYLADQYEIAKAATVETLEDGTIMLVMTENHDTVAEGIQDALKAD